MMFKNYCKAPLLLASVCGVLLLGLSSCAKYRARPFSPIAEHKFASNADNTLHVAAKELSSKESQYYFACDVTSPNRFLGFLWQTCPAYQVVHLSVYNDSDQAYVFRAEDCKLPLVDVSTVVNKIIHNVYAVNAIDALTQLLSIEDTVRAKTLEIDGTVMVGAHDRCNKFLFIDLNDGPVRTFPVFLVNNKTGKKEFFDLIIS